MQLYVVTRGVLDVTERVKNFHTTRHLRQARVFARIVALFKRDASREKRRRCQIRARNCLGTINLGEINGPLSSSRQLFGITGRPGASPIRGCSRDNFLNPQPRTRSALHRIPHGLYLSHRAFTSGALTLFILHPARPLSRIVLLYTASLCAPCSEFIGN